MQLMEEHQDSPSPMQRVKLYRLNEDGKWDDQGTGHVTVDYMERSSEDLALFVFDEADNETLLSHCIRSADIYRKQKDTIISWRDPHYTTELALSFQENSGCSYIWDQICNVQRSIHVNALNHEAYRKFQRGLRALPRVEQSLLPSILKVVVECSEVDQGRLIELILHDQGFFRKLMDLFRICENLGDIDGLHLIFKIVRGIILLNCSQIFEKIFGEELIMDICGCLEYDPEVSCVHHRSFLKEQVLFKEAIPIRNPQLLSKIHQTHKIGYLKDVVLPRILDEATIASLNSIIRSNNAFVVSLLKDDPTCIQELFARLKSPETPVESRKNLVCFLHEFCSLGKSLQIVHQVRLFRDLMNEGVFEIITDILQSQDKKLILTGTNIFILFLKQDPNLTRSFVSRQKGVPLLGLMVKGMLTDFGNDMQCQFLEILRSLLDSSAVGQQSDAIIEIFYEKHFGELIDVITASCPQSTSGQSISISAVSQSSIANGEVLKNICDLLCFCVLHHPLKIKCNLLLNNVIDKVLFLTRRREKYLIVAAVRFIRILISRNDDHLFNHIVKNNLLKPIIDVFVNNGIRNNLLSSVVLELFEHVRKENFKSLIKYIIDSFWGQLVKFANISSINSLKVRYEQSLESLGEKYFSEMLEPKRPIDGRALDNEEEVYINKESPRVGGLVDYDDVEDDNKDHKPPSRKQSEGTEENEGILDPSRLKRKLNSKDLGLVRRQCINRNPKSKDGVIAALCSTLSGAVSPSIKVADALHIVPPSPNSKKTSDNVDKEEKGPITCFDDSDGSDVEKPEDQNSDVGKLENHASKESPCLQSCVNGLDSTADSGHREKEDFPSIPSKP